MNKNRKTKRVVAASLAVGMAAVAGVSQMVVPVYAADTYKEETVYVNADPAGDTKQVTVSNWLKNPGESGSLKDFSTLKDIKNVKGDETFTADGNTITWNTDGEDIYYQGTTDEKLPVSVKITYYLDGKEMKPAELKGKSGHLTMKLDYKNNVKKTVSVSGSSEEVYSPFVMMTGMILPNETFSNVVIDNGKVVSDGNRSIVLGFAVPGLRESLGLDDMSSSSSNVELPESLEISADVTNFTMSSTFTVAMSDILDELNIDEVVDYGSLQTALDDLENAAVELVSGSEALSDGVGKLSDGAKELTEGIKKYTDGTNTLADGVTSYVNGEKQLAEGASSLNQLSDGLKNIQDAVAKLSSATDGKLENVNDKDLQAAASQLAAGTQMFQDSLGTEAVKGLFQEINSVIEMGNSMLEKTDGLQTGLNAGIVTPVKNIGEQMENLSGELGKIATLQKDLVTACTTINTTIAANNQVIDADNALVAENNGKIEDAKTKGSSSEATIQKSIDLLTAQKEQLQKENPDSPAIAELEKSIQALTDTKTSAEALQSMKSLATIDQKLTPVSVDMNGIDVQAIQKATKTIKTNLGTFVFTTKLMESELPKIQEQMNEIKAKVEALPKDELLQISGKVVALNEGMQSLNKGISNLHDNLNTLNASLEKSVPTAVAGIGQLNGGFAQLGQYNDSLVNGAAMLKGNSATLNTGADTLKAGTTDLSEGANKLAEGTKKFESEGTSKLKSTVEGAVGELMNRLEALTSDQCKYDSFSGKDSTMNGSVKFVIETESIE